MLQIINDNDEDFKPKLEQYKSAKRFHGDDEEQCRLLCEPFIQRLEYRLQQHEFLMGSTPSLLDYALLPFIRQFSRVDRQLVFTRPVHSLAALVKSSSAKPIVFKNHEKIPVMVR